MIGSDLTIRLNICERILKSNRSKVKRNLRGFTLMGGYSIPCTHYSVN